MASKLSGWVDEAVGAALVVAGVAAVWFCPPLAPYVISAGVGLMLTGVGTLISTLGGLTGVKTLSRNPIKPWDVVYGRARVAGTNIYTKEWGNNNKYIDIVAVLACHPMQDIYAVLFNGRMVQIDTTAVTPGVPASVFPAINGGTSFTPVQESHTCSSINRTNNVVTVVTQDIPLLIDNEYVTMSDVTADPTLNGTFAVAQILGRSGGNITFQYLCGGAPITISGSQGRITTMWVDYGRHVYIETMMGNQTLGTTFLGMIYGTPNEGDPTDLQHPPAGMNPWTANFSAVGRTVVFIRLNFDSTIFANGIPEISFLTHGKNNIFDPRTNSYGYTENSALCWADYMVNKQYGFRCDYGDEIDNGELSIDANICDEEVGLATAVPMAITSAVLSVTSSFVQAVGPDIAAIAWVIAPSEHTPWIANRDAYSTETDTYELSPDEIATLPNGTFTAICAIVTDAWGIATNPGLYSVYDIWIDLVYADSTTARWRPTSVAGGGMPPASNPGAAIDGDPSSAATLTLLFSEVHNSGGSISVSGFTGSIKYTAGTEPRYTCNGQFEVSMGRGQILGNLLSSCGGRITTTAGHFRCNPAAYAGVAVTLEGATGAMQFLANSFRWKPNASVHDLYNAVKGTYISPVTNWQVSDFPPYAQDSLHGYASGSPLDPFGDANLAADGGERRYLDIQLVFTISYTMAQRLAKIELLRRRQQGTGTFPFNLWGAQLAALDVLAVNLAYFGWVGKLLEVAAWRFTFTEKAGVVALATEVDLQETDPSVYAWYPLQEELTPQGYASPTSDPPGTGANVTSIAGPTNVVLLSDATTASIGGGTVASCQIKVTWTNPLDGFLSYTQIQYRVDSSPPGAWLQSQNAPPNVSVAFIPNVVEGTSYDVQIRSIDGNGAASPWVFAGPVAAGGATGQLFTVNGS